MGIIGDLLLSVIITAIVYMAFPVIKLITNDGKFDLENARKISLWNSVVVGSVFCVLTIILSGGVLQWSVGPALFYYWLNTIILSNGKQKEASKTTNNEITFNDMNYEKNPEYNRKQPVIKFCGMCGNRIIEGHIFCQYCGNRISTDPFNKGNDETKFGRDVIVISSEFEDATSIYKDPSKVDLKSDEISPDTEDSVDNALCHNLECPYCKMEITGKQTYINGIPMFVCSSCGKTFKLESEKTRIRVNRDAPNLNCPVCGCEQPSNRTRCWQCGVYFE